MGARPESISLVIERNGQPQELRLETGPGGYRDVFVTDAAEGTRYWYRVNGDLLPDPASRYQPDGPFAPRRCRSRALRLEIGSSAGVSMRGQVISEIHVGTFTPEGTWASAAAKLPLMARTGITMVEVMPVAEFPGRLAGDTMVFPFAPTRLYGTPDDFRAFIDTAHEHGLAVILDVVYNHLGPDGCVFASYSATISHARTNGGRTELRRTRIGSGPRVLQQQRCLLDR